MKQRTFLAAACLLTGLFVGQVPAVHAQLDKIVKGGLILVAIDKFGDDINNFVNKLVGSPNVGHETISRVVPILSLGKGTYAGAVQITGPRKEVESVKAVAQIEAEQRIVQPTVRVKGLIPVSDKSVRSLDSLKRVPGVGITALLDIKL